MQWTTACKLHSLKDHTEGNAFCILNLSFNITCECCQCWWYRSRGWIFLSITIIFFSCYKQKLCSSQAKWCLIWTELFHWNHAKKLLSLIFIETYWMFTETKQWLSTGLNDGKYVSIIATIMWVASYIQHSWNEECLNPHIFVWIKLIKDGL